MSDQAQTEAIIKMANDIGYVRGKIDDLVDNGKDYETRIKSLEADRQRRAGEKSSNAKIERFINAAITTVISAAIAFTAAYIDRQPEGVATNATTITQVTREPVNSTQRPAGGR